MLRKQGMQDARWELNRLACKMGHITWLANLAPSRSAFSPFGPSSCFFFFSRNYFTLD